MSEDDFESLLRWIERREPAYAEGLREHAAAVRTEGYARAREQAAKLAHAEAEECGRLMWNAEANGNVSARQCWQAARIAAASLATRIRAMQDGAVSRECEGAPDCGWHNGGPCGPCKAKVSQ